jgi:hypothetical protein
VKSQFRPNPLSNVKAQGAGKNSFADLYEKVDSRLKDKEVEDRTLGRNGRSMTCHWGGIQIDIRIQASCASVHCFGRGRILIAVITECSPSVLFKTPCDWPVLQVVFPINTA